MAELMRQVEISSFSGPDLDSRKDICSGVSFQSAMSLDMVRFLARFQPQHYTLPFAFRLAPSGMCFLLRVRR